MDTRTSQLAAKVRSAREAQGYRSQAAFAAAAEVSPRSVYAVESGERAGRKVLRAISRTLGWPSEAANEFLQTGDATLLAQCVLPDAPKAKPIPNAELAAMTYDEILTTAKGIAKLYGDEAADRVVVAWSVARDELLKKREADDGTHTE